MNVLYCIILIAAILCSDSIVAQEAERLSPKMELFKEYCIRVSQAAEKCDAEELIDCISQWTPPIDNKKESFIYRKTLLKCVDSPYKELDTSGKVDINGHLLFMPEYVDSLIVNKCERVNLKNGVFLRDDDDFDCMYSLHALKPNSKSSFKLYDCARNVELFVVPENCGMINVYVEDIENSRTYSDIDSRGKKYSQLKWNMYMSGDIIVTVENLSENAISFIMVISN